MNNETYFIYFADIMLLTKYGLYQLNSIIAQSVCAAAVNFR